MNLYSLLTLSARLSMLPARIALRVWNAVESHLRPTDDLTEIAGEDGYWLYWVYSEQKIPTSRTHTGTPSAGQRPARRQ